MLGFVSDGKSRALVRMYITRSSRSQAPRRRRRPKNSAGGPSLITTSSSSVAASAASHWCRVDYLKHEPSSAEVSNRRSSLLAFASRNCGMSLSGEGND